MAQPSKEQARYAYPKYKVFIFGVEVTDDCVGISKTEHESGAPNTCTVTLLNESDDYVITTNDMATLVGVPGGKVNIPWLNGLAGVDQSSNPLNKAVGRGKEITGIQSKRKTAILNRKNSVIQQINQSDRQGPTGTPISETNLTNYYGTSVKRYPFADGAPIFHSMDPVRIAMRDPFNPARWYWHFSGFVSDMVESTDENNVKTLNIVVEDPSKLFRYTRVFLNPGIIDAKVVIADEDLRVQSFYASFLRGLSLPEIFFTLFFGPDRAGTEKTSQSSTSATGKSKLSTKVRGIGHFALDASTYCTFGPEPEAVAPKSSDSTNKSPTGKRGLVDVKPPQKLGGANGDSLQTWQSLIDHEVQPSDLYTMATEADRAVANLIEDRASSLGKNGDKLLVEDVIGYIGSHPEQYLVDGGRLMMLIPASLGSENNAIMMNDIIQSYALNSEWHSAGEIMMEVISRIQFVMYATPKGDIVIEPPLYDFDPDDFGLKPISGDSFADSLPSSNSGSGKDNAISILALGELKFPGYDRGPYGRSYIILKRDTYKWESAFIDEKVYTIAICPHNIVQNWDTIPNTSIIGDMQVVRLPDLIPLYGVRPAPITPRGYLATSEAAHLFAAITLAKLNADSHNASIQHVPNIKLWLNRPIYVEGRNFIGTTKQITNTITWGAAGDMNTTSDLYAIRTWGGQVSEKDPTQPIFTTIGGQGSRPLDYSILFKKAEVPLKKVDNSQQDTSAKMDTDDSYKISPALDNVLNKAKASVKKVR